MVEGLEACGFEPWVGENGPRSGLEGESED